MADPITTSLEAQSAAVYRYAVELVEDTRRSNERRLADARELAAVVRIADEGAADRILSSAEEANQRDLDVAERQAEEVVNYARAGIMAAVKRYAEGLLEEQRRAAESRLTKAQELSELVRLADSAAAERMLNAIRDANAAALKTAVEQAQSVVAMAEGRLQAATLSDQDAGGHHHYESPAQTTPLAPAGAGYGQPDEGPQES